MNALQDRRPLMGLRLSPFVPMGKLVERLRTAFQEARTIRIEGFPVRVFCLSDPEDVRVLFSDTGAANTKLQAIMPRVRFVMPSGSFAMSGGNAWTVRRQQVKKAFNRPEVAVYLKRIVKPVEDMLNGWEKHVHSPDGLDIYTAMRLITARLNVSMFFSKNLDDSALHEFEEHTHFLETNFVRPAPLWLPIPDNLRFRHHSRSLRKKMAQFVEERRRYSSSEPDILSHVLALVDSSGKGLDDEEILDELLSVYFGATVLGVSLTWGLHLVASHPEVQRKLAEEVRPNGESSDELTRLPFSQAVIKEVLRLYPASSVQPRWTDHEFDLNGVTIPANSLLVPVVFLIQRDPKIWQDPESFKPERFTPDGEGARVHPSAYFPFSAGSRACIGAGLAPLIIQKIFAMILARYRLSCDESSRVVDIDFGFGIAPKAKVILRIERRSN
jgi:cytochrome P450